MLLLLLHTSAAAGQLSSTYSSSSASMPVSPGPVEKMTTPSSGLFVQFEPFVVEGGTGGGGGGGGCRGVMTASDESLAVALAVAVAAAAVCYTLTAASVVRRLLGYRLVSEREKMFCFEVSADRQAARALPAFLFPSLNETRAFNFSVSDAGPGPTSFWGAACTYRLVASRSRVTTLGVVKAEAPLISR